jgi:hypothetical protein
MTQSPASQVQDKFNVQAKIEIRPSSEEQEFWKLKLFKQKVIDLIQLLTLSK